MESHRDAATTIPLVDRGSRNSNMEPTATAFSGNNYPDTLYRFPEKSQNHCDSEKSDMERKPKRTEKAWGSTWYEFCQGTTLHGMKQLTEPQPFIIRRFLWVALVLAGAIIFAYQLVTSILYYNSWPVTVNIKINYNESLRFPALTICNQNAFRMTTAAKGGDYDLLREVYSSEDGSSIQWEKYNGSQVGLDELYLANAHLKHDLIVQCTWDGIKCGPDDLVQDPTDFGICYTFNGDPSTPMHAHETGVEGGLSLLLNVQQYEYMPGPNTGAGLKLSLHGQHETATVRDHGLAIPPGSHGFVALKVIQVDNLEPPHGKCDDSIELTYHEQYTIATCHAECRAMFVRDMCGCRDIYMPQMEDTPYCTLQQYKDCAQPALSQFHQQEEQVCVPCPVPCHSVLYEPTVSYASLSNFDMLRLLQSNMTQQLNESFLMAHETTQRVNVEIVNSNKEIIKTLTHTVDTLQQAFQEVNSRLSESEALVTYMMSEIYGRVHFHFDRGLDKVEFIAQHDFIRGFEIRKERYLDYVASNFYEVTKSYRRMVENINISVPAEDQTRKRDLWMVVDETLAGRVSLASIAKEQILDANNAYVTGEPMLTYKASIDRRYDMSYISLELLRSSEGDQPLYVAELKEHLDNFVESLQELRALGHNFTQTAMIDMDQVEEAEKKFQKACRGYLYRVFMFETRIVMNPVNIIQERINQFKAANTSLSTSQEHWHLAVQNVRDLIRVHNASDWFEILDIINRSLDYLNDSTALKTPIAEVVTSKKLAKNIQQVETFFANIRSRARDLDDAWTDMKRSYRLMWTNMLSETSTKNFYKMIHDDFIDYLSGPEKEEEYIRIFASLLRKSRNKTRGNYPNSNLVYQMNTDFHTTSLESKEMQIDTEFTRMVANTDVVSFINEQDELFLDLFAQYKSSLQTFLDDSKIDAQFYTENFLRLDVYMQELSYEEINQQADYDIIKLLSDIGGSLGLFLGASVLTVVEFLDVFIHFALKKLIVQN